MVLLAKPDLPVRKALRAQGVRRVHKVRRVLKGLWARRAKPGRLVRREPKALPVRKVSPVPRVRLVRRGRSDLLGQKVRPVSKVLSGHPGRRAQRVFKARLDPRE